MEILTVVSLVIGALIALPVVGWATLRILRDPTLAVVLLVFFLPFERIPSWEIAGFTLRINHLVGGLALVVWLVHVLLQRRRLVSHPLVPLLFLIVGSLLLAIPGANHSGRAITVTLFTLFTISLALLVTQLVTQRHQLKPLLLALGISAFLAILFAAYQFVGDLAGLPPNWTGLAPNYVKGVFGFPRPESFAHEPLFFGNYLLLPIALSLAGLVVPQTWFGRSRLWFLVVGLLAALGLTLSRGAIIAVLAVIGFLFFMLFRQILTPRLLGLAVIISLLALVAVGGGLRLAGPTATERFLSHLAIADFGSSDSTTGRLLKWSQALELWQTAPLVGIGPGNFGPASLGNPPAPPADGWPVVNNQYVESLAETGLIGFGILMVFLVVLLGRSWQAIVRTRDDPNLHFVVVGLTAAVVGMLVQYNFFSTLYIVPLWVTFGLLMAAQSIALRGDAKLEARS